MTELIIPVKPLAEAKQRLAGVLRPCQRAGLVLAMLEDVLETLSEISQVTTWVVSNDSQVLELSARYDCRIIKEPTVEGYNSAVSFGLQTVKEHCKDDVNVAFVPADIPLASFADLSCLTRAAIPDTATIRLAPSHDEKGTNGVFLSSHNLLHPGFGEDSFYRYKSSSENAGIVPEILIGSTLAYDIDTPVDLERLCKHNAQGVAVNYLHSLSDDYNNHANQ